MLSKYIVPALAAVSAVTAQTTTLGPCKVTTLTINSAADATALSSCSSVEGNIVVGANAGSSIALDGPSSVTGDVTAENNGGLISLTSSTISSITGAFKLSNMTVLNNLQFSLLSSVGTINWQSLPQLSTINFETGITKATSITISDTFLSSLGGISVKNVQVMDINNNGRLTDFTSSMETLSDNLNIQANGLKLSVMLPNLIWIANMSIANVTSFNVPSLATVNGSMRFDSNYFTSFSAPNLTALQSGDVSFIGNANLANLSLNALTSIGGALVVANNTALDSIDGFSDLKSIGGAIKLRGNFNSFSFPSLDDVKGGFDASSTSDITDSCNTISKLARTSQGGNNDIQGVFSCTSNNSTANSDTGSGTSSSGSGTSSGSTGNSSAAGLTINHALLGLSALGFAQALW